MARCRCSFAPFDILLHCEIQHRSGLLTVSHVFISQMEPHLLDTDGFGSTSDACQIGVPSQVKTTVCATHCRLGTELWIVQAPALPYTPTCYRHSRSTLASTERSYRNLILTGSMAVAMTRFQTSQSTMSKICHLATMSGTASTGYIRLSL
jgi:hypothetical protein